MIYFDNSLTLVYKVLAFQERFQKKNWKKYGLLPNRGGGGVSEGDEKPNCFFEKSIFQRVSRIILGPSKHVLHLVWSAYFISTAVRTALKVARTPQILGERRPVSKNNKIIKRIDFEMGPSVKFVSPNKGLISKKKIGGQFFSSKK